MKTLTKLLSISFILLSGCSPNFPFEKNDVTSNLKDHTSTDVSLNVLIDNGSIWMDTHGNEIKAQGGCIIQSGGLYHWFGPEFGSTGDYQFYAINHYTSSDLKTWNKLPPAFTPETSELPFTSTSWIGRPYVMWNPNTNKFVMAIEWGGKETGVRNQFAFLTSSTINGPWQYQSNKLIKNLPDMSNTPYALGDLGIYTEGNNAWLLYTFDKPEPNYSQAILKLDFDFMTPLNPTFGNYVEFSGGTWKAGVQEAAAVIKRGETYYYFTSLCNGWKSSDTRYRTAPTMAGPWTANAKVQTNPSSPNSFNTQHDFILPVVGTFATTYIYCGDRWSNYTKDGMGRNAWYPLTFDINDVPTINASEYEENGGDWHLDVAQGIWSENSSSTISHNGF